MPAGSVDPGLKAMPDETVDPSREVRLEEIVDPDRENRPEEASQRAEGMLRGQDFTHNESCSSIPSHAHFVCQFICTGNADAIKTWDVTMCCCTVRKDRGISSNQE